MAITRTRPDNAVPYKVRLLLGIKTISATRIARHIVTLPGVKDANWAPINKVGQELNIDFYFYMDGTKSHDALDIAMAIREMEMKELFHDFT